jgi:hypothetical protein
MEEMEETRWKVEEIKEQNPENAEAFIADIFFNAVSRWLARNGNPSM